MTNGEPHPPSASSSSSAILSPSPTLSVYSSRRLNDIASRVIHQLRLQGDHLHYDHDDPFPVPHTNENRVDLEEEEQEEEEEEEEFTFVCQPQYTSPTPADQIFCDGRIRPVYTYPVFFVKNEEDPAADGKKKQGVLRLPLGKFLMEERESSSASSPSWCSSSEEEEEGEGIEGAEPGSYCVWRPEEGVKKQVRKSGSRSSGRWRFRNYLVLLKRSTSDGQKDNFVIFNKGRGGGGGGGGGGQD